MLDCFSLAVKDFEERGYPHPSEGRLPLCSPNLLNALSSSDG